MKDDVRSESEIVEPLYLATERFDAADGEKWSSYCAWAKIPCLTEVVGLDLMLCRLVIAEFTEEDWKHAGCGGLSGHCFEDLDYLIQRVHHLPRINILGIYRNPDHHMVTLPTRASFAFAGYDLIEDSTRISALNNCGGFAEAFRNEELNQFGLLEDFARATEVRKHLLERYPEEPHANCELYAIWRLNDFAR